VKKSRVIIDVQRGAIVPICTDTVQFDGIHYVRMADGDLRPVISEELHSGPQMIGTAWHDDLAGAYAQAVEELDRRIEELTALRSMTLRRLAPAGAEVLHA
jgi:hypothetical protein